MRRLKPGNPKVTFQSLWRAIRYRLGLHVVAPQLEDGTDEDVKAYYNSRLSDCSFLADADHYERPRVDWILERIHGGLVLEVGCADGTFTEMLARRADRVVAIDLCEASIRRLRGRGLKNVETYSGFVEQFRPTAGYDWVVLTEVLEHLRRPQQTLMQCVGWLNPGGSLLVSTPEGDWEGDAIEHLHVFHLESFKALMTSAGADTLQVFRIKDRQGRDRWLGAEVSRTR
jgi:2-polyprenyl-3-methyl-5-hydroxy-6-metoxy-1,4-benzoquinol methylase